MAVQTRSPIARGNWVDIGNESKEQITRGARGMARALRRSGAGHGRELGPGLCVSARLDGA